MAATTSTVPSGVSMADMALGAGYSPGPQGAPPGGQGIFTPGTLYQPYIAPGDKSNKGINAFYNEVTPAATNLRNLALQTTLQQYNQPMQGVYLGQAQDAAAQQYGQQQGQLASAMASKGLIGSGPAASGSRGNTLTYLGNLASANLGAQQQSDQRQQALLNSILGTSQQDLNFYNSIRSGALPASTFTGPANYGWPQTAAGITQLVKTVASLGAGSLASAGGASGGLGMGADYGTTAGATGDYGMSGVGGISGAAGDYGMSYGGLNPGAQAGGGGLSGALGAFGAGGVGGLGAYYAGNAGYPQIAAYLGGY